MLSSEQERDRDLFDYILDSLGFEFSSVYSADELVAIIREELDNHFAMGEEVGIDALPSRIYPKTECQRNPIYLLQVSRWVCTDTSKYVYIDVDEKLRDLLTDEVIDEDYKRNSEDWYEEWDVERVFFDREEARAWAANRAYRWDRWRTFAVSAEGALAEILAKRTTYWDGKRYKA